jgi:outer membrane protein OmpA-like peptidoglycan-associated protein
MPRMRIFSPAFAAVVAALLVLGGCAVPPSLPGEPGAAPGTAPPPTMADEQRRLARELAGTPVEVSLAADGRLQVLVPLRHCFDAGRAAVKPALAAVLDQLATGLRQNRTATVRVAAPPDAPRGSALLASDRAASVRDYLVSRGVAATRFAPPARAAGEAVELLVASAEP